MGIKSAAVVTACALLAAALNAAAAGPDLAQVIDGADATTRLIIKLRPAAATETGAQTQSRNGGRATTQGYGQSQGDRARRLAERSGLGLRAARDLGRGMVAVGLGVPLAGERLEETLLALRADPDVEFAEVDRRRYIRALPGDPLYTSQWYLQGVEASATNFQAAWDTTSGSSDTVIAVLDTGIRFDHPGPGRARRRRATTSCRANRQPPSSAPTTATTGTATPPIRVTGCPSDESSGAAR